LSLRTDGRQQLDGAVEIEHLQRQMTDEELDALVYSHETRGTPEEGEAWLRGYVQVYPKQRLAWQRLQQILEHTQQLQEETGVWAR
ncbi:tetratricopeptide repeat protein, partial [Pseudomonas aeruginosa]